jgi:hypothetical protein
MNDFVVNANALSFCGRSDQNIKIHRKGIIDTIGSILAAQYTA